jgi:pyruvate dehydrogenase E2 component (dihydrolipoamide acetyltransferase)
MENRSFLDKALSRPEKGDRIEYFNFKGRVSANVLVSSQENIPSPAYVYNADITKLWDEFQTLKKECGYKLTFNTLMMRVLIEGLKAAPRLNAHLEYNKKTSCGRLIIKKHMNIAMPVVTEAGETFPVNILEAEDKSLRELSAQIDDVVERFKTTPNVNQVLSEIVRTRMVGFVLKGKVISSVKQIVTRYVGKYKVVKFENLIKPEPTTPDWIRPEEIDEGTVCFTNWGALDRNLKGDVTYAPILHPQVFLMAMGNVRDEDYAFKNEKGKVDIGTKKVLPLTLMFDHRIGGFADIDPFIKRIDEIFANPEIIREW